MNKGHLFLAALLSQSEHRFTGLHVTTMPTLFHLCHIYVALGQLFVMQVVYEINKVILSV